MLVPAINLTKNKWSKDILFSVVSMVFPSQNSHMHAQVAGPPPGMFLTPRLRLAPAGPRFVPQFPAPPLRHRDAACSSAAPQVLAVQQVLREGCGLQADRLLYPRLLHRPQQGTLAAPRPLPSIEDFQSTLPGAGGAAPPQVRGGQMLASSHGELLQALGFAACASTLPLPLAPHETPTYNVLKNASLLAPTYGLAATSNSNLTAIEYQDVQGALPATAGARACIPNTQTSQLLGVLKYAKKTGGGRTRWTEGRSTHAIMARRPAQAPEPPAGHIPRAASAHQASAQCVSQDTHCEVGIMC